MSEVKIIKTKGPKTLPWETPETTGLKPEKQPSTQTRWYYKTHLKYCIDSKKAGVYTEGLHG